MKLTIQGLMLLILSTSLTQLAYATPITINHLSSDDDGSVNIITDTLNNLEWLRWDETAASFGDINYMTTEPDGAYFDFTIATTTEALLFIDAITDSNNNCRADLDTVCETGTGRQDYSALVGDNWNMNNNGYGEDWAWYLSDSNLPHSNVGKITLGNYQPSDTHAVRMDNTGLSFVEPWCHSYDQNDSCGPRPLVGWLLYRSIQSIPEPPSIALLGIGLLGIGFIRKHNNRSVTPT